MKRRRLLRGMLHGSLLTVGLPWLEIFSSKKAFAQEGFPQRFGVFFWGNGNRPDVWNPTGEGVGDEWQLSETLSSLATFKDKLAVLSGFSVKVPNTMPHSSGNIGLFTGQAAVGHEDSWTVGGPSIDQLIAQEIGNDTVYRSLIPGCVANESTSWNGPNSRNPVDSDPFAFYERIFGPNFREPGEEGIVDPKLGYRRSVLDSLMADVSDLEQRMGAADKIRLEQHLDGIRELELRLARLQEDPPSLEACERPEAPLTEYPELDGRPQFAERNLVMSKMIAMALACDQTRVVNYSFTRQLNNHLFPDATDGHHNLTHHEPGTQPQVVAITKFCIEQYAVLLNELNAIQEGEGTLLDNCAFMACSEVSEGQTHSLDDMPLLIAGSASGKLQTNLHYRSYTQDNINSIMLSVIRAMGINIPSYGADDSYATDGLSILEV